MSTEKQCTECKETKTLVAFYNQPKNKIKKMNVCKTCLKKRRERDSNMKCCSRCKEIKPLTDFNRNNSMQSYQAFCKPCAVAYQTQRAQQLKLKKQHSQNRPQLDNALCQEFLGISSQMMTTAGAYL